MSDRPTPEQIIVRAIEKGGVGLGHHAWVLAELQRHGYVIVHPDDVPESQITWMNEHSHVYDEGWNDCRDHIFGASHE